MRILATGSRSWTDIDAIIKVLEALKADDLSVIQGGNGYRKGRACNTTADLWLADKGADALVYQACRKLGIDVETYFADWTSYGRRAAGPKRNAAMLSWLLEDRTRQAIAFHDNIDASKGTKDMLIQLRRARVPVTLFGH